MIDNISSLGARVRQLRRDLNWSQQKLADLVGVDRSYISQIENGHVAYPGGHVIKGLAEALGTTPGYILGTTGDPLPPPEALRDEVPDFIAKFNRLIEALPPHLQEPAIEYLRQQLRLFRDVSSLGPGPTDGTPS